MKLIDKLKLKLCGDLPSIVSLQMEIEDLQLENEELRQKNETISNNDSSYSKKWEDMFYKDWAEEIYQYEMKQELTEENTELYSQLQDLARVHEEMKQNYQNKIRDKNLRIIGLESSNNSLRHLGKLFGKDVSSLLNENSKLNSEVYSKDSRITILTHNNEMLEKRNKELENIQEEYNLVLHQYQRLKGVKEDFAKTKEEYVNKVRISYDLGAEENIEDVKLHYEKMIAHLNKDISDLTKKVEFWKKEYKQASSMKTKLMEQNVNLDSQFRSTMDILANQKREILVLKSEKEKLQKSAETFLQEDNTPLTRSCKEYTRFKKTVLKRDNYTCQCCGSTDSPNVHHQYSFAEHNYLGATVSNGIVLCQDCHNKYHSIYGYGKNNTPFTFAQFIRDYGKIMQSNLDSVSVSKVSVEGK